MSQAQISHCVRCGRCCLNSGPTLHLEDLSLVRGARLPLSRLYTLRRGEWGFSHVQNRPTRLSEERIKIHESHPGGSCSLYEESEKACSIYDHRPIQCRYQACWASQKSAVLLEGPFLSRRQVIPTGHPLHELIDAHGQRCSIEQFERLLRRLDSGTAGALQPVFEVVQWDLSLREMTVEKLNVNPSYLEFLFGRPLQDLFPVYGYKVDHTPDGPVLKRSNS